MKIFVLNKDRTHRITEIPIDGDMSVLHLIELLTEMVNNTPKNQLKDLMIEFDAGYNNVDLRISFPYIDEKEVKERELLRELLKKYPDEV